MKQQDVRAAYQYDIESELSSLEKQYKDYINYDPNYRYVLSYRYPINGNHNNWYDMVSSEDILTKPNLATVMAEIAKFYILSYAAGATTSPELIKSNPLIEDNTDCIYPETVIEYDPKEYIMYLLPNIPYNDVINIDRVMVKILRSFYDAIDLMPNMIYELDITKQTFILIAREELASYRYREAIAYQKNEEDKYDKENSDDEVPPLDMMIDDYFNTMGISQYYNDIITIDLSMLDNIRFSKVIEPSRLLPVAWLDKLSIKYDAIVIDIIIEKYFSGEIITNKLGVVHTIISKLTDYYDVHFKINPNIELEMIKYIEYCYQFITNRLQIYISGVNVTSMADNLEHIFNSGTNFFVYNTHKVLTAPTSLTIHVVVNSYRLK